LPEDGIFDVNIRSASKENSGELKILINDAFVSERIQLPQTGETQNWKTSTIKNIKFLKGWSRIRVLATSGGFNLNYLQFIPTNNTTGTN
ncbi:MAG TPA: carbohydrate-binding domain-containing protein, partial [Chitinophagaceae bacterium]|nr:carbohydrate-binding domain-containing protein [Chitinophagaceae bacterium]